VLGVIGPNGAGKPFMLDLIFRILMPTKGSIQFLGKEISGMKVTERTRLGLAAPSRSRAALKTDCLRKYTDNRRLWPNVSERKAAEQAPRSSTHSADAAS
jgi:ABC-type branched-subunit amino acid transport system ATPase component